MVRMDRWSVSTALKINALGVDCSKFLRRPISQAAVRTLFVVLRPPRRDLPPRIEQVLKPAHRQKLFPQPSMETLHARVLCRLPRLNVHQLDLPFHTARQKMPTRQLWSVVTANRLRSA